MAWTAVNFGKYGGKDKTLPQIVFDDPDWFFWALGAGAFYGALAAEAQLVAARAGRIRIPDPDGRDLVAEYTTNLKGKFAVLELVPRLQAPHPRSARADVIDLGYAAGEYDKLGCKLLVRQAKDILFGSESYRMTRERAEAFFDNDDHFALD